MIAFNCFNEYYEFYFNSAKKCSYLYYIYVIVMNIYPVYNIQYAKQAVMSTFFREKIRIHTKLVGYTEYIQLWKFILKEMN